MARKPSKVIVDARGNVMLRRGSGYHNRIGFIEKTSVGYRGCAAHVPSTYCKNFPRKSSAVKHVVDRWRVWIGLPPGHTNY